MNKPIDEKKTAAVLAAVTAYLNAYPEAPAVTTDMPVRRPIAAVPPENLTAGPRPWALAGRQGQMVYRRLMQWKTFHAGSRQIR
ncbi:MAG: hypothetical protein CSA22_01300 [Deltaproteobacteria bacterium]|nr:MAG: hypothetical protein CSA22_01300 [Deltaproteobacteria bacterium]